MHAWKNALIAATLSALLAAPAIARADPAPSQPHVDVEVDPTAYVLRGHSLHAGVGWGRLRADLGAFALALPDALSGTDDFDLSFDGYGAKLQYFLFAEQAGGFAGVDVTVERQLVQRKGTELASRHTQVGVGVHVGWRFTFGPHLYATPWLGLVYELNPTKTSLGGIAYQGDRVTVFPTVHLGYRFR